MRSTWNFVFFILTFGIAEECLNDHSQCPFVECQFYLESGEIGETSSLWILVKPHWAPLGAERFLQLVSEGYYDGTALYRSLQDFIVQFGLSSSDELRNKYRGKVIPDDANQEIPFTSGMMSYAGSGKSSRETQIFITLGDYVPHLGKDVWERPFGKVVSGLDKFKSVLNYKSGEKPQQPAIWQQGYKYLKDSFPNLSYLKQCKVSDISSEDKFQILKEAGLDKSTILYNKSLRRLYESNSPIRVSILNEAAESIKIFWVNREGREIENGAIDADGSTTLNSYPGHAFTARSSKTNALIRSFKVLPTQGNEMTVQVFHHKGEL